MDHEWLTIIQWFVNDSRSEICTSTEYFQSRSISCKKTAEIEMNRNETKAIPKTSPVSGCLLATSGKLGGFSDMSSEEGERTNPAGTPPHPLDEGAVYSIYTCSNYTCIIYLSIWWVISFQIISGDVTRSVLCHKIKPCMPCLFISRIMRIYRREILIYVYTNLV